MKPLVAFYAPIKPPDHPIVSGDREIARLMVRALERAGYEVEIASRFIAYQKRPSPDLFKQRKHQANTELERLKRKWNARPSDKRPALWFTYHPYCKAPDWLGPAMVGTFHIPYVTAETCRTGQGTDADWTEARRQVQHAARLAQVNFCLKQSDRAYLDGFMTDGRSIRPLAPFVDIAELDTLSNTIIEPSFRDYAPLLIAVGMMRPGFKTKSYLALAEALSRIPDMAWNLVIVGDGPSRPDIESAFAWSQRDRIHWTGAVSRAEVLAWFRRGDILAWPGIREAIGMVFLEAQSQGLPVAAFKSLGVPGVVSHNRTGLLAPENDVAGYADVLQKLLNDPDARRQMGTSARQYVRDKHDISQTVKTFQDALKPLIGSL